MKKKRKKKGRGEKFKIMCICPCPFKSRIKTTVAPTVHGLPPNLGMCVFVFVTGIKFLPSPFIVVLI